MFYSILLLRHHHKGSSIIWLYDDRNPRGGGIFDLGMGGEGRSEVGDMTLAMYS